MRRLLDYDGCVQLRDRWLEAHREIEAIRRRPGGAPLRRPPVPTILSESIAALYAPELLHADAPATGGRNGNDLSATVAGRPVGIAVKGSSAGWISVTASDRRAQCLIWLDFSRLGSDRSAAIEGRVFGPATIAIMGARFLLAKAPLPLRQISILLDAARTSGRHRRR